jgi:hypothetical protein
VRGFSHFGLAAQVREPPDHSTGFVPVCQPRLLHFKAIREQTPGVFSIGRKPGPPQTIPDIPREKGAAMKFMTISKSLMLGSALLLATSAFAANKAQLHLQNATTVNGTQLKAGDYKLQWDGTGPNVELSILQGKNVVTKTSAKLVDLPSPASNDAAVVKKGDDGSSALSGIRFEGKKYALEFGESGDGMGSSK